MISNTPYFQKNTKPPGQSKNYTTVRGGAFYGLKYEEVKLDPSSYKRGIVATPNFYFYDNFTKLMIDFSDYKNEIDEIIIDDFFSLPLNGITFSIEQGNWLNGQLTKKKISMNGTYVFEKYTNMIVFANVSSIQYYDQNIKRYDKNFFVNTPNIIMSEVLYSQAKNQTNIINSLGKNSKNSFSFLGAQIGDFISIKNENAKYQILNILIDEEGKEIITVNGIIFPEDRTEEITNITLFIDNEDNINIDLFDNIDIGKCTITRTGLVVCIDNQTEVQCQMRKNSKEKESATFLANNYCTQNEDVNRELSPTERLTVIAEQNNLILSQIQPNVFTGQNRAFI
jgi:hypothetical protein